ncbi:hypothetical protein HY625_02910 [Candidatus Uhrbacteria bacterium]|nr:hypothetical protein [Candidatus Uhrbacteria bacterium]
MSQEGKVAEIIGAMFAKGLIPARKREGGVGTGEVNNQPQTPEERRQNLGDREPLHDDSAVYPN